MDFRKATDELCSGIPHQDLAEALGVSVATVRQARLREGANARRAPPEDWERTLIELAGLQIRRYRQLISDLTAGRQDSLFAPGSRKKA